MEESKERGKENKQEGKGRGKENKQEGKGMGKKKISRKGKAEVRKIKKGRGRQQKGI